MPEDTVEAVKLLVLGGTKFLGLAAVEAALARGHEVTLFNRGETNPELFPEAEKIRGDRTDDLSALRGRSWDSVLDPSAYVPEMTRASVEALAETAGHYVFISSVSVYADLAGPVDEDSTLVELEDGQPDDRLLEDFSNYGPLKTLCERAASDFPGPTTLVRPGLIVGPHDPTGRFTYWPHRVARGGDVLAPGPPESTVQFIDVRDLGEWLVDLGERKIAGAFNAVHPGVTWEALLATCRDVSGSDARFVWVDPEFLVEREVGQWMELPMWLHGEEEGIHATDVSRALAAGLTFRPLEETVRGTLEQAEATGAAGLKPEREADLLEAWAARSADRPR
jgi:nucleoside-diphosphate-sugar epimerase